jgi:hypothetical protein
VKGYWTADDATIPSNMRAYHLFIDGVNPLWGQNGTDNKRTIQLAHDGLQLGLEYGDSFKPVVFHKIIVTPSAFNATYDAGFFVVPKSLNESKILVSLKTKYLDTGYGVPLDGATPHIDMDPLYVDVTAARICFEQYHLKPGTDKFYECFEEQS